MKRVKYKEGRGLHSSIFTTFADGKNAAIQKASESLAAAIIPRGMTVDEETAKEIAEAAANALTEHGERVCMPHYEKSEYGGTPSPCFLEAKCLSRNCPLRVVVFEEDVVRRPPDSYRTQNLWK